MRPDWKKAATLGTRLCAAGWLAVTPSATAQGPAKNPFDLLRISNGSSTHPPHSSIDLQHFSLTQLRMVGTLGNRQRLVALLADPNQHIYLIVLGSRIGPNQGIVTRIFRQRIELQERWRSASGLLQTRLTRLEMERR